MHTQIASKKTFKSTTVKDYYKFADISLIYQCMYMFKGIVNKWSSRDGYYQSASNMYVFHKQSTDTFLADSLFFTSFRNHHTILKQQCQPLTT